MKPIINVLLALLLLSTAVSASDEPTILKKTYVYKTVGDCQIQADVHRLPGDDIRPVIVWIHGGALIMGSREVLGSAPLKEQFTRYLKAGFTVVSIDYRLAPEAKLDGIIEDLKDAFKWVRAKGPAELRIDPDRLAVVGHSAGGYLTLMAGFCVEPRPQALVAFYGYGDIIGDWYKRPDKHYSKQKAVPKEEAYKGVGRSVISESTFNVDRGKFYLYCRQNGLWPKEVVGHDPDKEADRFARFCPIQNVTKDYPPSLLLHGDKDTDVPYEQSVMMSRELERHGVVHKLITMPGGGHGFDFEVKEKPEVSAAFDAVLAFLTEHVSVAPQVQRDLAYSEPKDERQTLDVYSSAEGEGRPVVFWIHGGGWQAGNKTDVQIKPQAFVDKGFVFVSTNYRLLPTVTIKQMAGDIAKAVRWVHDHAGQYGGDPERVFVMGHSAGAQLAALVCTDERYLKQEGLSLSIIRGCVPVDGDTYDVPMQIRTVEQRRADRYRWKFGDEASQTDLSPVTHVVKGKHIPPFLILHVADHPETKAQSQRLAKVLQEAGVSAKAFPAEGKNHTTINADLGLPGDMPTKVLLGFLSRCLEK
jgi:acetyl esterase/lipase